MLVIQHNLIAMNTNRQLGISTGKKAKAAEKLSSGYKLNRAADDAAGLTISEKMRWQIRGLSRGESNIGEGISLVQTADGAMAEMHSVLQRMRELSIQAYNDTNTKSDREAIQQEIDASKEELARIVKDTEFNTQKILQGNHTELRKITDDEEVDTWVRIETVSKKVPDWMSVDDKLAYHGGSNYIVQQDTSKYMYHGFVQDGDAIYYGPGAPGDTKNGYTFEKNWTPDTSDNPTAMINFSGLKGTSTMDDLKEKLTDLGGVKVSFPCGTCNVNVNSVTYTITDGDVRISNVDNHYYGYSRDRNGTIDMGTKSFNYNGKTYQGYFEAMRALEDAYSCNYDDDPSNDDLSGESNAIQELSDAIAKDLTNATVNALAQNAKSIDHFERAVKGNDDYSVIVYDYRDREALNRLTAADTSVMKTSTAMMEIKAKKLQPGTEVQVEYPFHIMCGALSESYISFDLPKFYLNDVMNFRVDRYNVADVMSPEYAAKMDKYEQSAVRTPTKQTVTVNEVTVGYNNGEPVYRVEPKTVERTTYVTTYTEPKPTPGPGDIAKQYTYNPSNLKIIDDMIASVSRERSRLGAVQNRLEHAQQINAITGENTQQAESKIRDTDMAEMMVEYSKHSILEQAGQSMLTQANQSSQSVIQLLQS